MDFLTVFNLRELGFNLSGKASSGKLAIAPLAVHPATAGIALFLGHRATDHSNELRLPQSVALTPDGNAPMDGNGWMAICTQLLDGMAQLGTETARHAPHGGSMGAHREDCNRARIPIVAGSSARCSIEAFSASAQGPSASCIS